MRIVILYLQGSHLKLIAIRRTYFKPIGFNYAQIFFIFTNTNNA